MRILILSNDYPNETNPIPSVFVHNQAKALQARGTDVAVLVFDLRSVRRKRKLGFGKYTYEGIPVYRYAIPCGPIPCLLEILSLVAVKLGFRKVIKVFGKPDLIHAHFALAGCCANQLKKKYKIPYILTEHASGMFSDRIMKRTESTCTIAYNHADYLIAVGNELKNKMKKYTDKKINVIYNMLPQQFNRISADKNKEFTFVTVGSLISRKRMDLVILAFSRLFMQYDNIRLIIIGTGPLLPSLKKMSSELKTDHVIRFEGIISNKHIPQTFNECHCFVLPSEMETFGVVYAEAAACGLPIIATDCGGPSDIVNQNNGLLIPKNNEEALFEAMKYMIMNFEQYDSYHISKDALNKFGEEKITENLLKAYRGILNESI
jgi:glycosyltransferase involved in cell wall biosynthesis